MKKRWRKIWNFTNTTQKFLFSLQYTGNTTLDPSQLQQWCIAHIQTKALEGASFRTWIVLSSFFLLLFFKLKSSHASFYQNWCNVSFWNHWIKILCLEVSGLWSASSGVNLKELLLPNGTYMDQLYASGCHWDFLQVKKYAHLKNLIMKVICPSLCSY